MIYEKMSNGIKKTNFYNEIEPIWST